MKIGLIQVQGIGDILLALSIARWHMRHGHQVIWPINADYHPFLSDAAPDIDFRPVIRQTSDDHAAFLYQVPRAMLEAEGCDRIIPLYSYLDDFDLPNRRLAELLTMDQYKYAVAGVPLSEKWNFTLKRDLGREIALHHHLSLQRQEYIILHSRGHEARIEPMLPASWREKYRLVHISELTDNPFDWIYTFEHAAKLVLLESGFSNLIELLDIPVEKHLLLHSPSQWSPIYKNGWSFTPAFEPIVPLEL